MKAAWLITLSFVVAVTSPAAGAGAPNFVKRVSKGSLRAEFSARAVGKERSWKHSRIKIWRSGRLIVDRDGGSGQVMPDVPVLTIRNLENQDPPEVMLNRYSGGENCCWETRFFTRDHQTKKSWGYVVPPTLRDLDGDGKIEMVGSDSAFAYQFSSFAESRFPAKVWNYHYGGVHDVTTSFPDVVKADMAEQFAAYQGARDVHDPGAVRAALAAYAADGYSLGQGAAAMAIVEAAVAAGEINPTADDKKEYPDFVEKLRALLRKRGFDDTR